MRWPMVRRRLKCNSGGGTGMYRGRPKTVAIDSVPVSVAPSRVPSPFREDAASSSQLRTDLALPESPSSSQLRTALGADAAVASPKRRADVERSLEPYTSHKSAPMAMRTYCDASAVADAVPQCIGEEMLSAVAGDILRYGARFLVGDFAHEWAHKGYLRPLSFFRVCHLFFVLVRIFISFFV